MGRTRLAGALFLLLFANATVARAGDESKLSPQPIDPATRVYKKPSTI